MYQKYIFFYIILIFFKVYEVYPNKEVVKPTTSLLILMKNDSLSFKYLKAKKLFDDKDYTKSLRTAFEILKENGNKNDKEIYRVNYLIGKIFYSTYDYKNALRYLSLVVDFQEDIGVLELDKRENFKSDLNYNEEENLIYLESLLSIGSSYYKLNLNSGDKIKLDSALYYYKKVANYDSNKKEFKLIKAKSFNNISAILINESLYTEAREYLLNAVEIYDDLNNKINQAKSLGNISSTYLLEEDYEKAKETYFNAIELIKNIKTDEALIAKQDLYYNLAWNLYNMKDYKAYDYQELSYNIKDSIREKQFRGIIAEINEKYNFDVKKNLLLKEEENKRLKAQRPYWIIGGLLIAVIFFTLLYRVNLQSLKRKNLELKFEKSQLAQSQQIDRIRSESQTRILNATIDGKETERKQIAETLHDSVSALLSSANLHLQATKTAFNGKTPIEIDKTRDIITEASHKIRDLSHSLVSSILLKFGLKFAIKDMAKKYSNSQIEIITDIGSVRRYEQDFEIKVHNITQEFLNNILKHSKATEAKIELEEKDKKLYLKVTDNGKGFDKTKVINKDGLGINQIEARIIVMKGKFVIDSEIGKGTSISVEIPVKEKEVMHHA